ncbi:MAG: hypothetical protein AAF402_08930 [Pseudomonadota bacterium]
MWKYIALFLVPTAALGNSHSLEVSGECKEGVPHGLYSAKSSDGVVRIEGRYDSGLKDGDFTFYTANSSKLIVLPYSKNLFHGTVNAWHPADDTDGSNPVLKLSSEFEEGLIEGRYQTWYATGVKRSDFTMVKGEIVKSETWNEDGTELAISDVVGFMESDVEGDFQYYSLLESVVDSHSPQC